MEAGGQRGSQADAAGDDAQQKFVKDFVAAWDKVMSLDCFDLG